MVRDMAGSPISWTKYSKPKGPPEEVITSILAGVDPSTLRVWATPFGRKAKLPAVALQTFSPQVTVTSPSKR